jgi:hypothetical protein
MKQNPSLLTLSICIAALLWATNDAAAQWRIRDTNSYSDYGKRYKLCHDLVRIFNHPANEGYGLKDKIGNPDFLIPKGFPEFRLPKWEEISVEELKSVLSPEVFAKMEARFLLEEKVSKIVSPRWAEKASIDLDHDGKKEQVIRYGAGENFPKCRTTIAEPAYFNERLDDFWQCFPFYYQGRIYIQNGSSVIEGRKVQSPFYLGYGLNEVCAFINSIDEAKTLKALKKHFPKSPTPSQGNKP